MKNDIHPNYRPVVFVDKQADFKILTGSTMPSRETIQWEDGNEYPVVYVDISSASHPYFTGKQKFVDTMGRVEKFRTKYAGGYKSVQKKK
ncbi:MAG: type B 50S ribosomal protein L31 [Pirellulaceae bacterium]|nr:type B 50S ribosomal protein L31 [Planctomycetales bacterium]